MFPYRKFNILKSLKVLEFPKTSGRENKAKSRQRQWTIYEVVPYPTSNLSF